MRGRKIGTDEREKPCHLFLRWVLSKWSCVLREINLVLQICPHFWKIQNTSFIVLPGWHTTKATMCIFLFTLYREKHALFRRSHRNTGHNCCDYIIQGFNRALPSPQYSVTILTHLSYFIWESWREKLHSKFFFQ